MPTNGNSRATRVKVLAAALLALAAAAAAPDAHAQPRRCRPPKQWYAGACREAADIEKMKAEEAARRAAAEPPADARPPDAEPVAPPEKPPAGEEAAEKAAAPAEPADAGEPPPEPVESREPPLLGLPVAPPAKAVAAPAPAEPPKKPAAEASRAERGEIGERPSEVYAEDWWTMTRPVFDIHGYYRVRAEFFHNFALGRKDIKPFWPQPVDNQYVDMNGTAHQVVLCGDDPLALEPCESNTQAGANMRFRLAPELHISDNLRVLTQIDLLDNVVLGSTPEGYTNAPAGGDGGYAVVARGGYSPTSAFAATQWAPVAGQTSLRDSIVVKRVWGEYVTPIGQIRFGRMPSHWGLGIFVNGGDGYDSDWQSTADRLMFITGYRPWDLYAGAAWDFANEGATSASLSEQQGQPFDLAQGDDVDQWVFVLMRRRAAELQKLELAQGKPVFNGGVYFVYRHQKLANDVTDSSGAASLGASANTLSKGLLRRGAEAFIPDGWFQFLYEKFRFEAEFAAIVGSMESTVRVLGGGSDYKNAGDPSEPGWLIRMFGLAAQAEYRALEDKLGLQFDFGWASGDPDVESLAPLGQELQPQLTSDRTFSTFRFHPDYRVDLILFRNILTRVQGAYYFKPAVGYDFLRDTDGQRIGGQAALIWSRASEFIQTPGHARDLGVELNFKLYYQAKDGVLNDDPDKMGGFYTSIQYGVLFPLDGLGFLPGEETQYAAYGAGGLDTETAQTVRWYLGILF